MRQGTRKVLARARVAHGARLLDKHLPGWADMINLDDLKLSERERCVCGQLGPALVEAARRQTPAAEALRANHYYASGVEALALMEDVERGCAYDEVGFPGGFITDIKSRHQRYETLDRHWHAQILRRRAR